MDEEAKKTAQRVMEELLAKAKQDTGARPKTRDPKSPRGRKPLRKATRLKIFLKPGKHGLL